MDPARATTGPLRPSGNIKRPRPQGTGAPASHPRGTTLLSVTAHSVRYGPSSFGVDDTRALLTVGESDQAYWTAGRRWCRPAFGWRLWEDFQRVFRIRLPPPWPDSLNVPPRLLVPFTAFHYATFSGIAQDSGVAMSAVPVSALYRKTKKTANWRPGARALLSMAR
jgi:hypothetical protein